MKMNICFYRYSLLNRGGDRMVVEHANNLADSGHSVTFLSCIDETVFRISPQIARQRIPCHGLLGFLTYTMTHKLPYEVVIVDIIHLAQIVRCTGKLIYYAQADDIEYYEYSLMRNLIDCFYRRFFNNGGQCITVSDRLSEIFSARYAAHDCRTVDNGIDLETFYPEPDPKLIASKGTRKAIFFMARGDRYRKGHDLALDVFAKLPEAVSDRIELWVCGDRLKKAYPFLVRHFGVVDDNQLRRILSSVDLFFYPSRHEGFGLFPLEAMACGSVVVTTDAVPYAHEYSCIHTAQIGQVDQMLNLFEKLVMFPGQIEQDRSRGLKVAAAFDLKNSKLAFAKALSDLVGSA